MTVGAAPVVVGVVLFVVGGAAAGGAVSVAAGFAAGATGADSVVVGAVFSAGAAPSCASWARNACRLNEQVMVARTASPSVEPDSRRGRA